MSCYVFEQAAEVPTLRKCKNMNMLLSLVLCVCVCVCFIVAE